MRTGKYALCLIAACFKSGVALVALLVMTAVSLLPAFPQNAIVLFSGETPGYYQELYTEQQAYIEAGIINDMPEHLREITRRQTTALESIANASSSQEYYSGIAQYTETLVETFDSGNLVGTDRQTLIAEKELYSALSKLEDSKLYHDTSVLPALPYACYVFAQMSSIVWLAPPLLLAAFTQAADRRPHLMGSAPVSHSSRVAAMLAVPSLLSPILLIAAFLPVFLFRGVQTGFGSLSYPVVFVQNEAVIQMTVGTTLLCQLALYVCACVFISSITLLITQASQRVAFSLAIATCLCLLPTMGTYFDALHVNDISGYLRTFLPITYLSFGHITGYPGAFPSLDLLPFKGASFQMGVIILVVSAALSVLLALGISFIVKTHCAHRRMRIDA